MSTIADHQTETISRAPYVVGFSLSVILTLISFWIVSKHILTGHAALFVIACLAVLQFVVQVLCFLHLAEERRPRLKLVAFLFMLLIVSIVVVGSLWIMANLNYHMMTPVEQSKYLHDNEGL